MSTAEVTDKLGMHGLCHRQQFIQVYRATMGGGCMKHGIWVRCSVSLGTVQTNPQACMMIFTFDRFKPITCVGHNYDLVKE
uniref:Uncharacterized protein n=1 Tax=Hyaloperonospora arabidopsidis (strain Emoy2) TaxID=559515 RepID=M4BKG7_HYAAE